MAILQFMLGLFGLGILVFIHEAGHFVAAKSLGITVEKFSLGWGKPIVSRKGKDGITYQLGAFPLGGFVMMKGETQFREAMAQGLKEFPFEPGSFFSAAPWKRIVIALAGPAVNLLFAIMLFGFIYGIGYEFTSFPSKILLAPGNTPALQAGLQDGDRITSLGGNSVQHFTDLQRIVSTNPERRLSVTFERNGSSFETFITPDLSPERGSGIIGVFPAVVPILGSIPPGFIDQGLALGDQIIAVNGTPISFTRDLFQIVDQSQGAITLDILRNNQELNMVIIPDFSQDMTPLLPLGFQGSIYRTPELSLVQSIQRGLDEVGETLALTIRSLSLIVQGRNTNSAVSGPLRISVMVGQAASVGFSQGISQGLRIISQFLAIISVALAFGNLLPIPVLDGGQALMYTYELVSRKPLTPKTITRFQTVGAALVLLLLVWALFSDVLFIFGR